VAEAAPLLGLTVDGLRSRIRRGLVTTRKGNDGRLLVSVSANARATGHEQVTDTLGDRSEASEASELRAEVVELRVTLARAEERLAAAERRERDQAAVAADLRVERDRYRPSWPGCGNRCGSGVLEALRRRQPACLNLSAAIYIYHCRTGADSCTTSSLC
jgi:hypothetical protein